MGNSRLSVLEDPRRFWDRVLIGDGCWEWQGNRSESGYGRVKIDGVRWQAPRLAYKLWHGRLARDLFVCHACDNPPCVRPDHLWLGTQADNLRDAYAKGRKVSPQVNKTHCPAGHPYAGENLVIAKSGQRVCRQCARAHSRSVYWKNHVRQRGPYRNRIEDAE